MTFIEAVPAYGRDYSNQKAIQADWDAGMDFLAMGPMGPMGYINKQDAKTQKLSVIIRYAKQMKVFSPK